MRKNVSFEKRIDFPTMVGEISAISLEEDLKGTIWESLIKRS